METNLRVWSVEATGGEDRKLFLHREDALTYIRETYSSRDSYIFSELEVIEWPRANWKRVSRD